MNDFLYYTELIALVLRLLGVFIGAGLLLEYLYRAGPMKWLLNLLNRFDVKRYWLIFAASQNIIDKILSRKN